MSIPYVGSPGDLTLEPFPHLTCAPLLDDAVCASLLQWLRSSAPWRYHESSFFRQMECDLLRTELPEDCRAITDPQSLDHLRGLVERAFETKLATRMSVVGHKLFDGYQIGIHNDAPDPGMETHRLVLQLNPADDAPRGGSLLLFRSKSDADVAASFPPGYNSAVAFALSDRSFHAVTPVEHGVRYTVDYSFWTVASAGMERSLEDALSQDALATLTHVLTCLGADRLEHSGRSLLDHLLGTCEVLRRWGCAPEVCKAGLFHSVYGTESFHDALVQPTERTLLRELLSPESEELIHLFSTTARRSLYESYDVAAPPRLRVAGTDDHVPVTQQVRHGLLLLDIANFIEQAARESVVPPPDDLSIQAYRRLWPQLPVPVRQSLIDLGVALDREPGA